MNSTEVLDVLDRVAATSSRTEKERILGEHIGDPLMKWVVQLAYDPFVTFGVKPKKAKTFGSMIFENDTAWFCELIDMLATRGFSGNAAKENVETSLAMCEPKSSELLWRILNKDLRAGFTDGTVNRVLPGTIPVFDVMLAHKFEEKRIKQWPVAVEPKLDGVRVICLMRDDKAQFFSRTGKPFPAIEHLGEEVVKMVKAAAKKAAEGDDNRSRLYANIIGTTRQTLMLDGEIVSGSFNKTVSEVRRKDEKAEDAIYNIFDATPLPWFLGDTTELKMGHKHRRDFLAWMIGFRGSDALQVTESVLAMDHDQIYAYYQGFRDRGLEGAIVKPLDGLYAKKRSHAWLKMKACESEDLRIVDAFEGTGKYEGMLGGLIVTREHEGELVEVRVGGGFSDQQRKEFWDAYLRDTLTADEPLLMGRLVEIEFHEILESGSLRHPRFVRWRDDKDDRLKVAAE